MSLIKPISFLQKRRTIIAPSAVLPKAGNVILRYENVNVNNSGGNWTDTSGLGYTLGRVEAGAYIDAPSNSVILPNTGSLASANARRLRVTTNTNVTIRSLVMVFNMPLVMGATGTIRNYFYDMRRANTESPDNGGYFNQVDSVSTSATQIHGNDGVYYSYNEANGVINSALATNPTNLTNGTGRALGGSGLNQWFGPNGRAIYTSKRIWLFNYNTNRPLNLTTTAADGLDFGTNSGAKNEGGVLGLFSIIGWNVALTAGDFTDLVNYYKAQGVVI